MRKPTAAPKALAATDQYQEARVKSGLMGAQSSPPAIKAKESASGMNPVSQSIKERAKRSPTARMDGTAHPGRLCQRSQTARLKDAMRSSTNRYLGEMGLSQ